MCPGLWAAAIVESEEAVPQLEEAGDQQLDGSVIAAAPVPRVLPRHLQMLYPIALGPSCCCSILCCTVHTPKGGALAALCGCVMLQVVGWIGSLDR